MLLLGPLAMLPAQAEQSAAREKPRITVTEVEALRGESIQVTSLNDRGVIVGAMYFADIDRTVPISWNPRDGVEKVVGDLPGAESGIATDINNRGTIVGNIVYNNVPRGFIWSEADGFIDLGSFVPNAINDRGQIAGTCVEELSQNFQFRACFWQDCAVTDLSDGARFGGAFGINDRGEVVGQVDLSAFVWSPRTGTVRLPIGIARAERRFRVRHQQSWPDRGSPLAECGPGTGALDARRRSGGSADRGRRRRNRSTTAGG